MAVFVVRLIRKLDNWFLSFENNSTIFSLVELRHFNGFRNSHIDSMEQKCPIKIFFPISTILRWAQTQFSDHKVPLVCRYKASQFEMFYNSLKCNRLFLIGGSFPEIAVASSTFFLYFSLGWSCKPSDLFPKSLSIIMLSFDSFANLACICLFSNVKCY